MKERYHINLVGSSTGGKSIKGSKGIKGGRKPGLKSIKPKGPRRP